jgi:hypothetical protein
VHTAAECRSRCRRLVGAVMVVVRGRTCRNRFASACYQCVDQLQYISRVRFYVPATT